MVFLSLVSLCQGVAAPRILAYLWVCTWKTTDLMTNLQKFHSFNEHSWSAHYWLMPVCKSSRAGDAPLAQGQLPLEYLPILSPALSPLEFFLSVWRGTVVARCSFNPWKALIIFISFLGGKMKDQTQLCLADEAFENSKLQITLCCPPAPPPPRLYLLWRSVPEFWERLLSSQQHLVKS